MTTKREDKRSWDVKVTSKGQVTVPKEARDIMMVREGDHLEATIHGDSLVLKRRDEIPENEKVRLSALRDLVNMGIDPNIPHPELTPANVRKLMPRLPVSLADRIRAQREGRDEP